MKRLSLLLIAWILLQSLCFAAGSVTVTCAPLGNGPLWVATFSWTGDASGGSVPATAATCLTQNVLQGHSIVQAETIPGSPAPTNTYAVTVTDANGVDITAGQLAALSSSAAAMWTITAPPLNGGLTIHVTGNSVNSAQGTMVLYLAPGNYARSRGGGASSGGGSWGSITGTLCSQTDLCTALAAKLPLGGGTMTGSLLFTDASFDIGSSGATRPRDLFLSRDATVGRNLVVGTKLSVDGTTNGIQTTSYVGGTLLSGLTGVGKWTAGVPGVSASADIISLWSGTCNAGSVLAGDGSCAAVSPLFSGLTPAINSTTGTFGFSGSTLFGMNHTGGALPTLPANSSIFNIGSNERIAVGSIANPAFVTSVRWDGTVGSLTAVQANEQIGGYNSYAYNGSALNGPTGSFRCFAAENQDGTHAGTYCESATTPLASTTLTAGMRWQASGGVTLPSTVTGGDKGAGTFNVTGLYQAGSQVLDGTSVIGSQLYTTISCAAVQNVTRYLMMSLVSTTNCTTTDTSLTANTDNSKRLATRAGTLKRLFCQNSAALNSESAVLTVRANGADTAVTCTITGAGTTCSDTTHTGTSTAGGTVSVSVVTSTSSGTANYACAFENEFIP